MLVLPSCWRCASSSFSCTCVVKIWVRDPQRGHVHALGVRVPACCTGQSFPSWRAGYSLSSWAAALPGQDSDHLAHSMTSSTVKPGLDYCVSPPRSLVTFTIIQCFFSTFLQGKRANTLSDCFLYSVHT